MMVERGDTKRAVVGFPQSLPSRVLRNAQMIRACLLDGLNYACARHDYVRPESRRGALPVPHDPNDYIRRWYYPLLRRGFGVPFFLVLDLGLMFLEGSRSPFTRYRRNFLSPDAQKAQGAYYRFLSRLSDGPIQELVTITEQDARRERVLTRSRRDFPQQRFETVPLFLERCLTGIDVYSSQIILDLEQVKDLSFKPSVWTRVADRMAQGSDVLSQEESKLRRDASNLGDINLSFLETLTQKKASWKLWPTTADRQVLRSSCLFLQDYSELDLMLLSNYRQNYELLSERVPDRELGYLKRTAAVALPSKSRRREGGYQGISYDGTWPSMVRSQLALLSEQEELFLHNYYNHKILYYERYSLKTRPLTILVALLVDVGPSMRRFLLNEERDKEYKDALGCKSALAKEIAAYLVEDVGRHVGMMDGIDLDFYILLFPARDDWPEIFFRFTDEQRSLIRGEQPVLANMARAFPTFFRLDSLAVEFGQQVDNLASESGTNYLEAIRRFKKRLRAELYERERKGEGEAHYDSMHFAIFTDYETLKDGSATLEQLNVQARAMARRQTTHLFALSDDGVDWFVSSRMMPDPDRLMKHEDYNQIRECQEIREGFLTLVVQEALRARSVI